MAISMVKIQKKGAVVIPRPMRELVGVTEGDLMEVQVLHGDRFLFTPKLMIDRDIVVNPKKSRKELLRELAIAVDELRQDAKEKGIDKMSKREIQAAVTAMRRDLKKEAINKQLAK